MRHMKYIGTALVCATLAASAASAESLKKWGESGLWGIWVNPVFNNGCLMRGVFSGGTEVRMGVDNRTNQGYIAMFNDAWNIQPGNAVPVHITIDGARYDVVATELAEHGRQGAVAFFDEVDIFYDIANKQQMNIFVNNEPVTGIDLTGTRATMPEVIRCQGEQNA